VATAADAPDTGGRVMTEELERLTLWIPARLVNVLNARAHWTVDARRARMQRDAVCAEVLRALGRRYRLRVGPAVPKTVHFHAYVAQGFDMDSGLPSACKYLLDGLIDAGLLDDDGPRSGHVFTYEQTIATRKAARGVRITIQLRGAVRSTHP
jgi:hypothetical protein